LRTRPKLAAFGHRRTYSRERPNSALLFLGRPVQSEPVAECQTPYYVLQWVAVAKQRDVAVHQRQGAGVGQPIISQLYLLVVANMFSQILVFVSSCCNPIIYAPLSC